MGHLYSEFESGRCSEIIPRVFSNVFMYLKLYLELTDKGCKFDKDPFGTKYSRTDEVKFVKESL